MNVKLTEAQVDEAVRLYQDKLFTLRQIGNIFGVSHAAIHKRLKARGIETAREPKITTRSCAFCAEPIVRHRQRLNVFCSHRCQGRWLRERHAHGNVGGCQGRYARAKVREVYGELPEGSVVHHIDGDGYNHDLSNLMLFADNGDHVRWHRGFEDMVTPLWAP